MSTKGNLGLNLHPKQIFNADNWHYSASFHWYMWSFVSLATLTLVLGLILGLLLNPDYKEVYPYTPSPTAMPTAMPTVTPTASPT